MLFLNSDDLLAFILTVILLLYLNQTLAMSVLLVCLPGALARPSALASPPLEAGGRA